MHNDTRAAPAGTPPERAELMRQIDADPALWTDFLALCDHGGRLAGTPSERAAQDWCASQLQRAAPQGVLRREPTPYAGWTCSHARLTDAATGQALEMTPLLGAAFTPPGGLEAEVLDLGRGTPADIEAAGAAVRGKAVMVRHEYPFSTTTVHRRVKLNAAQQAGAAAFIVAQPEAGVGVVSGSSGRAGGPGIPSMGVSAETAARLSRPASRVRIEIEGRDLPDAQTDVLVLDLPGRGPERVVLSAHIDGHPLAESAIDNATGVAAVLAITRQLAPWVATQARGLTVCLFSAEEWALQGSRVWLSRQDPQALAHMALNVNLDSLAGAPGLTALTSGFEGLSAFIETALGGSGHRVGYHLPLMSNSDHANFAAQGIPAMRLIAGFDEPASDLRLLLTPRDRRHLVEEAVLRRATATAALVVHAALRAGSDTLAALRRTPARVPA